MKKLGLIKLAGLLFIVFGITDLNLDDMSLMLNLKAYAAIGIGALFTIISFAKPNSLKD